MIVQPTGMIHGPIASVQDVVSTFLSANLVPVLQCRVWRFQVNLYHGGLLCLYFRLPTRAWWRLIVEQDTGNLWAHHFSQDFVFFLVFFEFFVFSQSCSRWKCPSLKNKKSARRFSSRCFVFCAAQDINLLLSFTEVRSSIFSKMFFL